MRKILGVLGGPLDLVSQVLYKATIVIDLLDLKSHDDPSRGFKRGHERLC